MNITELNNVLNANAKGLKVQDLIFLLKDIEELLSISANGSEEYKNMAFWTNVIWKIIREYISEEDFNEFVDMWL